MMKEKNKVVGQKKFDLQDRFIDYTIIFWLLSPAICRRKDEMLDIFSTPSNSPYARGELISFCCRQFPSLLIGGRVRDGGYNNSNKPFSHRMPSLETNTQGISNPCEIKKRFHGTGDEGKKYD